MAAEISTLGRLSIGAVVASGTPADPDLRWNFSTFAKGVAEGKADANQTRGELSRRVSRVRTSRIGVSPQLEMQPTAIELGRLLDLSLGAAPSGTTYALGNVARRACIMYDDTATVWKYAEAAVNRLSLRSSDTDPTLHASISLLAKRCVPGATWPTGLATSIVDEATGPFIHEDTIVDYTADPPVSAVVVGGAATNVASIEVDIDNSLLGDRFLNSVYLTDFVKPDRHITLRLTYPYGDYPNLYANSAADAGVAVVITYTNAGGGVGGTGTTSLVLSFANVQFPKEPIQIPMRGEVMHQLVGTCYRSTSTEAFIATLDLTP